MLLVEPDFAIEERLAAVIADAGARVGNGVIVDPVDHYFTDEQMIAITKYANHPVTRSQALSFYPGARPVEPAAHDGVRAGALFASSPKSYVVQDRARYREEAASAPRRSYPLAVAAEGKLAADARPFRMIVVGDADFASNSFFPYLANADIALAGVSWLLREERLPNLKPPVEVLPTVTLTSAQVRWIFILTVLLLPGAVALHRAGRVAMAPALTRWAWPAAAALAFAFLVGLALQGGRPDIMVEFKPGGLMTLRAGAGARDRDRAGRRSQALRAQRRALGRAGRDGGAPRGRPAPVAQRRADARADGGGGGARAAVGIRARRRQPARHRSPGDAARRSSSSSAAPIRWARRAMPRSTARPASPCCRPMLPRPGSRCGEAAARGCSSSCWPFPASAHVTSTGLATLEVDGSRLTYRLTLVAAEQEEENVRLLDGAANGDTMAAERVAAAMRQAARFSIGAARPARRAASASRARARATAR